MKLRQALQIFFYCSLNPNYSNSDAINDEVLDNRSYGKVSRLSYLGCQVTVLLISQFWLVRTGVQSS